MHCDLPNKYQTPCLFLVLAAMKITKSAVSQKILSAPNKTLEGESSLTDKNETPMAEIQTLTNTYFRHMTHSPSVLFADTPTHTHVPGYSE